MLSTFALPPGLNWSSERQRFADQNLLVLKPTPDQLDALLTQLVQASAQLRAIPLPEIVAALDRVTQRWLDPACPERQALVPALAAIAGYSQAMLDHVLGRMALDWRAEALWQRINAQLHDPLVLDMWRPYGSGMTRAWGPELIWHVTAGNVPGVAVQSLIDGLLAKAPALIKPASAEPLLAATWVHMLCAELPALAPAMAVIWWPGGSRAEEQLVLQHASTVIINGSNAAVADLRARMPAHVQLLDYGSRLSFAVVTSAALQHSTLAADLAYDIAVFDQSGCVSPQLVFVEGSTAAASTLAAALDAELAAQERTLPRGPLSADQASAIRQHRDAAEWRELAGQAVSIYGPANTRWSIIVDPQATLAPGCGGRTITLRPLADLTALPTLLAPLRPFLQSVALAATGAQAHHLAELLARSGVSRITVPGAQGWPQPAWHHDGRNPLSALLRWSDWEAPAL